MKQKKQAKKQKIKGYKKTWVFGVLAIVAFVVVLGLLFAGMASTINSVKEVAVSREPAAILASAGVSEDREVLLPVSYYDQRSDECVNLYDVAQSEVLYKRQFGWENCGYYHKEIEKGMVEYELGDGYLPVLKAGNLTSNRGLGDATRWFTAIDGKSASYIGAMKMEYISEGAKFFFNRDDFYPLDDAKFSDGDTVNSDGHNHLFTMGFAVPFTVLGSGEESFEVVADDDTFVFVGDKLAIDLGGVHDVANGRFLIQENGEVYAASGNEELAFTGITLEKGNGSMVRIFHADRDANDSVFNVTFSGMNITIVDTKMAQNGKGDSMQIAYDPTDPTYEAPLGQSVIVRPDTTKGYMLMATIEGVMVVVFSIFTAVTVKVVLDRKNKK
ncbi:hypothetical protein IJI28_01185 [Candidatus Saccharibacteria bacterium]|nr:hypothetical protein [Candidatus Saccharibacteria bacterium]